MGYRFAILLFVLGQGTVFCQERSYQLSNAKITFTFVSKNVDGSISGFDSASIMNFENPSKSKLKGSVAVETLKTGNFIRDWSLKGSKYFDVDTYPKIIFESTSVVPIDNGFTVTGDLGIKGKNNPISIVFKRNGNQIVGTTTLFSSDFDIHIKNKHEDNKVIVKMVFDLE